MAFGKSPSMLGWIIPNHRERRPKFEHTFQTFPSLVSNLRARIWKKHNTVLQNRLRTMKLMQSRITPVTTFASIAAGNSRRWGRELPKNYFPNRMQKQRGHHKGPLQVTRLISHMNTVIRRRARQNHGTWHLSLCLAARVWWRLENSFRFSEERADRETITRLCHSERSRGISMSCHQMTRDVSTHSTFKAGTMELAPSRRGVG